MPRPGNRIDRDLAIGDRLRLVDDVGTIAAKGCEVEVIGFHNDSHLPYRVRAEGVRRPFLVARPWVERVPVDD